MTAFDCVVRGGHVVDGSGGPGRTADVAIRDGVVVEVGRVTGRGVREIDADGAVVAPGFVDIHTHYDGQAEWDSYLHPSSWHGVTTTVFGNCGVGFAPARPEHRDRLIALMEGIEDIPGSVLDAGLSWEWETFPQYLDALERIPHDVDIAAQLPHAPLRVHVMGDRALARAPATPDDIASMGRIAREAVTAGALGFTTSRLLVHRTLAGEVVPTYGIAEDELLGISGAIGEGGSGVLQIVTNFDDVDSEFDLIESMAEVSRRPISFSLAQDPRLPAGTVGRILARVEAANDRGLTVHAQVATRAIGMLMGLQCTLHPFVTNTVWQTISELPAAEQSRRMKDPAFRSAVLGAPGDPSVERIGGHLISRFDVMYELGSSPDYEPDPSESIAAQATRAGLTPQELAYDSLVADDGAALLYLPAFNFGDGNLDPVYEMLRHPYALPGLSDGGAHVNTTCDASFTTTLLEHWVRDREGDRLDLEFVVARQARATACAVGLFDRGLLAPGHRADLNVVDLPRVRLHRPEMRFDLPTGKSRLVQRADGYMHTLVTGVETYRDGESTGELPGRLVRGPQQPLQLSS